VKYLIVDLNIYGRDVLIVGAGHEGTKKAMVLANYNCNITVISKDFSQEFTEYKKGHSLREIKEKIEDTDFLNKFNSLFLIVSATDDRQLNSKIIQWAKDKGVLSYSADDPENSDIAFVSLITIEDSVQIAISTLGKSPIMTKIIKSKIESSIKNIIGKRDIDNIKIQEFARMHVKKYIGEPQKRKEFLYKLIGNPEIQDLIIKGNIDKVKERIINTLDKLEDNKGR
jgi:precorrin-2 dehydrogenase/sirohydrochlorin ferrochelatase